MPRSEIYNADCLEYMKTVSGGYFDLAIVDPPYGIGESGEKNHIRGKLAKATDYKGFEGGDTAPRQVSISTSFSEYRKIK